VLLDQIVEGLLVAFIVVTEEPGEKGLLLAFLVVVLVEEFFDRHHFLIEHVHFFIEGLKIDVLVAFSDLPELLVYKFKISSQGSTLLSVE